MSYKLDKNELKEHLKEQILFLIHSSISFDKGFAGEAKRLATTLRVLLHDTDVSKSLLSQLNYKNIPFCNTALEYHPENLSPTTGLITTSLDFKGMKYLALLDKLSPARNSNKISFESWWDKNIVFDDKKNKPLTRKNLILTAANEDGGAHIDPKLNQAYAALSKLNSLAWACNINGEDKNIESNPVFASIRQIAHEVLKTIHEDTTFKGLNLNIEQYFTEISNLTESKSSTFELIEFIVYPDDSEPV